MEQVTREGLHQLFEVNAIGMAMTGRAFGALLRQARGRIVILGGSGSGIMTVLLVGAGLPPGPGRCDTRLQLCSPIQR